jgi:Cdc6-like AAA superfamily ATPase
MYTQVKELGSKLDKNHDREQIREALNWISTLNFRSQQARHKSLMEQYTGAWFLRSQEFESWVEQPSQTLFCPGIPGAGKTMMAAAVVDHLERNVLDQSLGKNLAYVFCDYKDEKAQSVDQLLGSLLQQLVQNNHELAGPLIALHEAHAEKKSLPSVDELVVVLQSVISTQTAVYIVIDAIDECLQRDFSILTRCRGGLQGYPEHRSQSRY